jgi:hypothetical protein
MLMKKSILQSMFCVVLSALAPSMLKAEAPEAALWPNEGGVTVMTPSGWGASNGMVFFGIGRTTPQVYASDDDMGAGTGIGIGNPERNLGIELSADMNDVSAFTNFSYGFKIHRILVPGTSIAVGGEHMFYDKDLSDAGESYYVAISQAVQSMPSANDPEQSKLHLTLGVGNGRFSHKSPDDVLAGKGEHGTHIFGAAAYEIYKASNLVLEWSGINLNAGISSGILSLGERIPVNLTLAAGDLTRYSGDKVTLFSAMSFAVLF